MRRYKRAHLGQHSSALAIGFAASISGPAFAQGSDAPGLDTVVVTAERKESNLQETPIAISAFSQASLDKKGITDIDATQNSVVGLQFGTATAFTAGVRVAVRGIGTDVITTGGDQSIALHMDGVYLGKASAGLLSFYDLERLEVLRGPQGTLYGRNATGGSINIISAKPTQDFIAKADVLGGNYGRARVRGVIGGGLSENLAARVTATWEKNNGTIENLNPGVGDLGEKDDWMVRAQLLYDVSDNVEIIGRFHMAENRGTGPASKTLAYPAAAFAGLIQPPVGPLAGSPFGVPNFQPVFATAQPAPSSLHQVRLNQLDQFSQDAMGANLEINVDLGFATMKSLTAWFDNETNLFRDGDGSELPLYIKARTEESEQFTQELTLSSNSTGPLEWQLGAFYFSDESGDFDVLADFPANPAFGATGYEFTIPEARAESTAWAVFGQASYFVTEDVRITGGIRYSYDKKDGVNELRLIQDPAPGGLILVGFPQSGAFGESWDQVTYKVGVDYFVTDSSMLYGSFSTGYKAGGVNINAPADPVAAIYDPETIDAWEIGSKNRFFDDRFQLNVSAFWYDYSNLQLFAVTDSDPIIQNAAESEIKGIEVETQWAASNNLQLDFSFAYLDATFTDFMSADPADPAPLQTVEDLSGNRLPQSPEFELVAGAQYTWPLPSGDLSLSSNYHWQDKTFFRAFNDEDKAQDAYGELDARLEYVHDDGRWRVALFGKNLTDKEAIRGLQVEAGLFGAPSLVNPNQPRTWGGEVGFEF